MRKFRVFVEGRNFLIDGPDGPSKHGFITARFVEAADHDAAEELAISQVQARESLREMVLNREDDPPMLYATEIDEIEAFDGNNSPGDQGLIWYDDVDDDETPEPRG